MQRRDGTGQPAKGQRQRTKPKAGKVPTARASIADRDELLDQRTRERNEAREQLAASSEVLKAVSRSTSDLSAALDMLLETACRLCEADIGTIRYEEGAGYRLAATFGCQPEWHKHLAGYSTKPDRSSVFGQTILKGSTVHIRDVLEDPDYARPQAQKLMGFRAALGVPLMRDGHVFGVVNLFRTSPRAFTQNQIDMVETFAAQATIAIENARLLNELRQRTDDLSESLEQQTASGEILASISGSMTDTKPVFDAIVRNLLRLFGSRWACVQVLDDGIVHMPAIDGEAESKKLIDYYPRPLDKNTMGGRAMLSKHVLQFSEIDNNPEVPLTTQKFAREFGFRSAIFAPMIRDNRVVGAIGVANFNPKVFSDKQVALIKSFADQAVIAIENTRLLNELRESLQQQTATADVLKVISASPGELDPVFREMLENATRICDASYGAMWLREEDAFRNAAFHGALPAAFTERWRSGMMSRLDSNTPLARAAQSRKPLQVADLRDDQAYRDGQPLTVTAADPAGIRTLLAVPMLKDDELVGAIVIYRKEVRSFTDKQVELVKNFAAQAVIAIENARLLNELRARTNELAQSVGELRALGEVSQAVNSTLELEKVLTTIVGRAVDLSHTDTGAIYVFDEERKEFRLHATYGMSEAMIAATSGQHSGLGHRNLRAATAQRKPVQVADIRNEPTSPVNEIILREGYRGILAIPLLRPDDIVGALVVRRKTPGEFPQSTIDLLQTFADQSVVAIQNARLYANVETRTRELAASLEDLRSTQDRLVQTQKLASLGQLTAGIAHEIKNPLNFVNNFSGLSSELIDELQDALSGLSIDQKARAEISELTDTLRGNLDKVVQHGKRADAIVKNMLLHSREGSGEHRVVDINALVEESVNLAWHGARAEKPGFNIALERSLDPAAGEVDVFPQDITKPHLQRLLCGDQAENPGR